jgi:hypothetical protein
MADDPKSFGTSPVGGFSRFSLSLAQSGISSPRLSLPKISSSWTSAAGARFVGEAKQPYPHPGGTVLTSIKTAFAHLGRN